MAKSTGTQRAKASTGAKWKTPYRDFPLSYHPPSGRLYKKIKGRRVYFGYASDWQAAVDKYTREREDLYAGREPRPQIEEVTVRDLLNRFLTAKQQKRESGELSARSFEDYKICCERIAAVFGKHRAVVDLDASDFERLRADIATTNGPVRLGNEVQRVRSVFKYGYDSGMIDRPVRFGPEFKRPPKRVMRQHKAKTGGRMFEAEEILQIFEAASPQIQAMILLAVNCGFGNDDCGKLPLPAVDLENAWVDFPRPKTGIERRCPLWPETVEALSNAIASRPKPKDKEYEGLVFITKYGDAWAKPRADNPLAKEFRKLLLKLGLHQKGRGFYALRHVHRTIADETRDFPACDRIMGHARDDMASVYRERISDERLKAVVEHVRKWLFSRSSDGDQEGDDAEDEPATLKFPAVG